LKIIDIDTRKRYNPFGSQLAFHRSNHRHKHYGGGFGSGKTMALIGEIFKYLTNYSGIRGLLVRKTEDELLKSSIRDFLEFCPVELIVSHDKQSREIKFFNGSVLLYAPGDISKGAKEKIGHAQNLSFVAFEELHEISEELYLLCDSRVRQVAPSGQAPYPHRMLSNSNPNGHDWVWKRFISENRNKELFFSIVTKTSDNPYLPSDYEVSLRAIYSERWIARYLDASYDEFSGLVYPEFDAKAHVIDHLPYIDDFEVLKLEKLIGRQGLWFRSIDQGWTNPTVCLLGWVFPRLYDKKTGELNKYSGNVYIVDEYYMKQKPVSFHAERINEMTGILPIRITFIDPSCYNADPKDGNNIANEYARYGVYPTPANHEVSAGLNKVREYLKMDYITGSPKLYFNKSRIHNLLEEIGSYKLKDLPPGQDRNVPEEPVKKDDHCMDALRYLMVGIYEEDMKSYDHDPEATTESQRIKTCIRFNIDPELGLDLSEWENPDEEQEL